jgi:hypothetical protein
MVTTSLGSTPAPFYVIPNYVLPCLQQVHMAKVTLVRCNQTWGVCIECMHNMRCMYYVLSGHEYLSI